MGNRFSQAPASGMPVSQSCSARQSKQPRKATSLLLRHRRPRPWRTVLVTRTSPHTQHTRYIRPWSSFGPRVHTRLRVSHPLSRGSTSHSSNSNSNHSTPCSTPNRHQPDARQQSNAKPTRPRQKLQHSAGAGIAARSKSVQRSRTKAATVPTPQAPGACTTAPAPLPQINHQQPSSQTNAQPDTLSHAEHPPSTHPSTHSPASSHPDSNSQQASLEQQTSAEPGYYRACDGDGGEGYHHGESDDEEGGGTEVGEDFEAEDLRLELLAMRAQAEAERRSLQAQLSSKAAMLEAAQGALMDQQEEVLRLRATLAEAGLVRSEAESALTAQEQVVREQEEEIARLCAEMCLGGYDDDGAAIEREIVSEMHAERVAAVEEGVCELEGRLLSKEEEVAEVQAVLVQQEEVLRAQQEEIRRLRALLGQEGGKRGGGNADMDVGVRVDVVRGRDQDQWSDDDEADYNNNNNDGDSTIAAVFVSRSSAKVTPVSFKLALTA